jgi:hypothetical protein
MGNNNNNKESSLEKVNEVRWWRQVKTHHPMAFSFGQEIVIHHPFWFPFDSMR